MSHVTYRLQDNLTHNDDGAGGVCDEAVPQRHELRLHHGRRLVVVLRARAQERLDLVCGNVHRLLEVIVAAVAHKPQCTQYHNTISQ